MTKKDKEILESLKPVAEGIARIFGKNCEVVIHSLENENCPIIKIVNGHVTGRKVGNLITEVGKMYIEKASSSDQGVVGSYLKKTPGGRTLKSTNTVIKNRSGKTIGLLCINLNLSAPLMDTIQDFFPPINKAEKESQESQPTSLEGLIRKSMDDARSELSSQLHITKKQKNKLIVFEMLKKGIFDVKGAIDLVAQEIGVSRYTVYNYLREAKILLEKNSKQDVIV